MEKCFEYFKCEKKNCPAFTEPNSVWCWEITGTHCHHEKTQDIILKYNKNKCKYCLYYKNIHSRF